MTAEYKFTNETGVISVDTSTLLSDVEQEWKQALGDGLDTDASTSQGTLIQDETLARTSVMKNNAELASVINPSYSYGTFLDDVAALTGTERGKNLNTVAREVIFEINNGVTVPAGSRIRTSNGDIFTVQSQVVGTGSPVRGVIQSEAYGYIPVPIEEFVIVDGLIGWGAVRSDALTTIVPGITKLSDPQLKVARKRRLYQQGVASLGAIYGRLLALDGVTSVMAIENDTGAPGTVRGITFTTANGVWVCVAGTASDYAISETLFLTKQGGQPWDYGANGQGVNVGAPNGVNVKDPSSKLPYFVKWTRPVMYDAYVTIQVKQGTSIATASDIKDAILNYAAGLMNGEEGFVVGASISAFEIGGAVMQTYPGLYVKKASVATVAAGSAPPAPAAYGDEWVAQPFDQAQINIGFIQVSFV